MSEIWFGLPAPAGAKRAWGARAIYEAHGRGTRLLAFLPDRQSYRGEKIPNGVFKALVTKLQHAVAMRRPDAGDDHTYEVKDPKHPGWTIQFNPRMSHGYMYCLIWRA